MGALTWDELTGFLETAQFTGVLFEGDFDEHDGKRQFHAMANPVYLESPGGLLKLSTGVSGGDLAFAVVDAPTWESFGEDWEEMDKVGVIDQGFTYFGEQQSVQCLELRCAIGTEAGWGHGAVLLAEMTFTGEQRVLFDPWWPAGIRVQTAMTLETSPTYDWNLTGKVDIRTWGRTAAAGMHPIV